MDMPVNNHLSLVIADLGTLTERRFAAMLVAHNLSVGEYRLIRILTERGPMTPSEVIPHITLEQSLVSRTAQRLFEKRLITRRRSRTDRRNVTLTATPEGVELVRDLNRSLQELEDELTQGIPQRQLQQATRAIAAMLGNLEEAGDK